MCRHLFLVLFMVWIVALVLRNRESTSLYHMSDCRMYTRRHLMMYTIYALAMACFAITTLPEKVSGLPMVAAWLAAIYAPIVLFRPSFQVYYDNTEAEVFRTEVPKTGAGKGELTKSTYQATMMPFYKDEARTHLLGRLYSSAEIYAIDSIRQNEVIQCTTYVFEGTDPDFPKGTITMQIENKNDIHDIFPPSSTYRGYILAGSNAYAGMRGTVDVNIREAQRRAVFTH